MNNSGASNDRKKLSILLSALRNEPVDSEGATDDVMSPLYQFLMGVPASNGTFHWFCDHADEVTTEAATFLLRLFAYSSVRVESWKARLKSILASCCACVKGMQEAKRTSQATYLSAFPEATIKHFMSVFDEWELGLVLEGLSQARTIFKPPPQIPNRSWMLLDAPCAMVYHMMENVQILNNRHIQAILEANVSQTVMPGWPSGPPAPGLLLLLSHNNIDVRRWAKLHLAESPASPIPDDQFVVPYLTVLECTMSCMVNDRSDPSISGSMACVGSDLSGFAFSRDPVVIWAAFDSTLPFIPTALLRPGNVHRFDVTHLVAAHLHDSGPEFPNILRGFLLLLKRLGSDLWTCRESNYPQIVFDSIKDNVSYSQFLQSFNSMEERPWMLFWFAEYLQSIWILGSFSDVLAKMADFLCEELQHERFQAARPIVMIAATTLFRGILKKTSAHENTVQQQALTTVLDIHADRLISIAFSRPFMDTSWRKARVAVRDLVMTTLRKDTQDVSTAISSLSRALSRQEMTICIPNIRRQMWRKAYENIQADDSDAMAAMLSAVASSAHQDTLTRKAFSNILETRSSGPVNPQAAAAFKEVNQSLLSFRDGFSDAMSNFLENNSTTASRDLLRRPGLLTDVMALMLCPVGTIQLAAQTLVGQAFDVDMRLDCFRALLQNFPDESLRCISIFIQTFCDYAAAVPEACSLSKFLVRCLTDVIEVLCTVPDGLLHDEFFLKRSDGSGPRGELPHLWTLMTRANAVIFKKTPSWSNYFETDDMVVWMRDALIFARDMLAQWRVFESAASHSVESRHLHHPPSSFKLSKIGKRMINDLQLVLPELARWLRLTDEELLHQSFALLQSLLECFLEAKIMPSEAGLTKLQRHVRDARTMDASRKRPQTRLDSSRIAKLEGILTSFEESSGEGGTLPASIRSQGRTPQAEAPIRGSRSSRLPDDQDRGKLGEASLSITKPAKFASGKAGVIPKTVPSRTPSESRVSENESDSSSEGSQVDGSDNGEGLATLEKLQRTPQIKRTMNRRQVKVLELPGDVRNSAQHRLRAREDARRTALRLRPDISELHRILLSWPYEHTGPDPPPNLAGKTFVRVPDRFRDYSHYRNVFEPLLLLECWAQIMQSKEEKQDTYGCKIVSRQFIDDWMDLDIIITESLKKGWFLSETDIVLLRHPSGNKSILAKTQAFKSASHGMQTVQASMRCFPVGSADPGLQINTTWQISKVMSLSTLHREFGALKAMQFYDEADTILQPKLSANTSIKQDEARRISQIYNVNDPQAIAIASVMKTDGFSLIQGPPGTGKTSTICGLVQALLSDRHGHAAPIHIGNSVPGNKTPGKKVLLCAPSNAAIDQLAYRLKEGFTSQGRRGADLKVVRVGSDKAVNITVKEISLDNLVDQRLEGTSTGLPRDSSSEITSLRTELESVRRMKQQKQAELLENRQDVAKSFALEEEIKKLNSRRIGLTQQVDQMKDKQKSDHRTLDATRRRFRAEVLSEADVICSTLSGSGHDILEQIDFDTIIIDEAAQAVELSSLIPLKYRCRRCVMVGDPQQLPPTVISQEANRYMYNQSLFVRLQKHSPGAVHLLSIQYRMHPEISRLPSALFYDGQLRDGPQMLEKTKQRWHTSAQFGPYRFFNVPHGQESPGPYRSIRNTSEVQIAASLFGRLRQEFSSFDFDFRVGVVSMYRAQIQELRRIFEERFGSDIAEKVDFNTVDGFQGQEKDIIILSCVRAGPGLQSIGFLSDVRRINVALTRARSSIFVLGHAPTLERSDMTWRKIIQDARLRSCFIDVNPTYFTSSSIAVSTSSSLNTTASFPVTRSLDSTRLQSLRPTPSSSSTASTSELKLSNLATPQALRASTFTKHASEVKSISQANNVEILQSLTSQDHNSYRGQKRPYSVDNDASEESSSKNQSKKSFPIKRKKQAVNLFIPKNARK